MPNLKDSQITPLVTSITNNVLKISATSLVYDNYWLSFYGAFFSVADYISGSVNNARTRFFQNRNYAVFLLIGLDRLGNVSVTEGPQVPYNGVIEQVSAPSSYSIIPLVGLVIVQDGSNDLSAFLDISNKNVIQFSGAGNIVDKNKEGDSGFDSMEFGDTGHQGHTGLPGYVGLSGDLGHTGMQGPIIPGPTGDTGIIGMTGISWTIHFPLKNFI